MRTSPDVRRPPTPARRWPLMSSPARFDPARLCAAGHSCRRFIEVQQPVALPAGGEQPHGCLLGRPLHREELALPQLATADGLRPTVEPGRARARIDPVLRELLLGRVVL